MNLLRVFSSRAVIQQAKFQKELDIWRLYHLLYYFEQSHGQDVKVPRPEHKPYRKQYQLVHEGVNKQVISLVDTAQTKPFSLSLDDTCGVRLCGKAAPGTVVCFYPGVVFLPYYLNQMPSFPNISKDNPYLMSRTDGSVIDAKDLETKNLNNSPFGVGHLVRHPPNGLQPNVLPFSYRIGANFPSSLLAHVPNRYFRKPFFLRLTHTKMHCIVFVAMRVLKDEELFLNFRLHPDSQLPDGYCAIDKDEDRRRWKY